MGTIVLENTEKNDCYIDAEGHSFSLKEFS